MTDAERISVIRQSMPADGMFVDKDWLLSPQAFPLSAALKQLLADLGPALRSFQRACNELYFTSAEAPESALGWVAKLMDQGKPEWLVQLGRTPAWRDALPGVIRPDLVITETGVALSEIDSLPGGMGLLGWLNETYAALGQNVIGGAEGMVEGFASAFPREDILVSAESSGYEPEMRWLAAKLDRQVYKTSDIREVMPGSYYRFFELFDLENVEHARAWLEAAVAGDVQFTPPIKPFLEEKLWLALFWNPALKDWWQAQLSGDHLALLQSSIPEGWVLDPVKLPPWAVWPGVDVHSWQEMKPWGRAERELVVKISGYSELGWGSRGVEIGHDVSQQDWAKAIDHSLASFPSHPYILQRFKKSVIQPHPTWDEATGLTRTMQSRTRLCPYYFIPEGSEVTNLCGVLATVCPSDKKILHGMKDAMMLPCV